MRRLTWSELDSAGRERALARPARRRNAEVEQSVRTIMDDVRRRGGEAVTEWSQRLDGCPPRRVAITQAQALAARAALADADLEAIRAAADNVRRFHQATAPRDSVWVETTPGVRSRIVWRAVRSAGLYVPGGTAPLFSSLLMLAIPADVAGVGERIVMTPPSVDGEPHPAMIVAAQESGIESLWLIGGAQAIAALTFGAKLADGEIAPVDKLFGPGNAYVAEAKRQAAAMVGGPAVDMPAGPSELMVLADAGADPGLVAADLLSQAEHDADAQVLLVCDDRTKMEAILAAVAAQLVDLPRADIAQASLSEGRAVLVDDLERACEVANLYGPEHLSIHTASAEAVAERIVAAGAVFVGRFAAETFGDYMSGPSHVLPTDGAARVMGGVATSSFMTSMSVQQVSRDGARRLAPLAARLARLEGLEAHARAAELRGRS